MKKKEDHDFKKWRVREELKMDIIKAMIKFKSKEEPSITLTDKDKAKALIEIASKYI
jgi:hypothetical protein